MSFVWVLTGYAALSCMTWAGLAADPPLGTYRKKPSTYNVSMYMYVFAYAHLQCTVKDISLPCRLTYQQFFQRNTQNLILRRFCENLRVD